MLRRVRRVAVVCVRILRPMERSAREGRGWRVRNAPPPSPRTRPPWLGRQFGRCRRFAFENGNDDDDDDNKTSSTTKRISLVTALCVHFVSVCCHWMLLFSAQWWREDHRLSIAHKPVWRPSAHTQAVRSVPFNAQLLSANHSNYYSTNAAQPHKTRTPLFAKYSVFCPTNTV